MNHRFKLAVPLALVVALVLSISLGAIHPVRALTPVSTLYLTPNATGLLTPGASLVVNITGDQLGASASSGINGWDLVFTDNDPSALNLSPVSLSIVGNLLASFATVSEQINCVNAGAGVPTGMPGNIGCDLRDGSGIVHTAAVLQGPATPTPISGLVAKITYAVNGAGEDLLNILSPCPGTQGCDTLTDGTPTPVPHITLAADIQTSATDFAATTTNPAAFNPGASSTGTFRVTSLNGYSKAVTVKTDVVPATGLTVACPNPTPSPVTAGGTSSSTCSFSSKVPGVYAVTVNATDGTLFHLAPFTVKVGDFTVGVPTFNTNIPTGNTGAAAISVTSLNGFSGTVAISRTIAPATGLTVTCPTSLTATPTTPGTGSCSLSSSTGGSYAVTVNGTFVFTGGKITHLNTFTVNIQDFTIVTTSPQPVTFVKGTTGSATVTVTALFSWNRLVNVTGTSSPTGVTVSCGAAFVPSATGTARACSLTSTTTGSFTVTVTGTCNSTTGGCTVAVAHSTTIAVVVQPGVVADFTIQATSPADFNSGAGGSLSLTVTSTGGFAGTVTITTSVSPVTGLTVTCPGSVTLTAGQVFVSSCTLVSSTAGTYRITITGQSTSPPAGPHSTFVQSHVGDFTISATGKSFNTGTTGVTLSVSLTSTQNFAGTVNLSGSATPTGLTVTCTSVSLTANATVSTTCALSSTTPGVYVATVTGTAATGTATHAASATVHVGDFTISAASTSFNKGATGATVSVSLTSTQNFAGTVNLVGGATPTGLTVTCTSAVLTANATVSATCTLASTTPGVYVATVTGTASTGTATHAASATVHVGDFTISATSPSGNSGSTLTSTITLTSTQNFAGQIALVDTVPSGLSCQPFNPTPVTIMANATVTSLLPCTATVTVMTSFPVPITGNGSPGTASHGTSATFTFSHGVVQDFTISAMGPVNFNSGASGASTVMIGSLNGFTSGVTLTAMSAPSGVSLTGCSPNPVSPPSGGTVNSICTFTGTVAGTYTVTITGTGSTAGPHSTTIIVHVGDFTISATATSFNSGATGVTLSVSLTSTQNFAGTVNLVGSATPTGLTVTCTSANLTANATVGTICSLSSTTPGVYLATVTGTAASGTASHAASATVHVGDFTIAPTSPVTVPTTTGVAGTQMITVTAIGGFTGVVTLVATNPSSGLSCQPLSPPTVTGSGTSTLSCSATAVGDYTVTVKGTSGTLTHSTALITFHVTVTVTPDFTIAPTIATTVNAVAGVAGTQTIALTATNGFTGTVNLATNTPLPAGLTCLSLSPVVLPGTTTATLSCTAQAAADYGPVVVTGTSGSLTHSTGAITFHVTAAPDFTIAPAAATTVNAVTGTAATQMITVTATGGFNGVVMLTAAPQTGLTCQPLSPGTVTGSGTSTLSCMATVAADYTVTVTGTSGSLTHHTGTITYHVTAAPDFTIAPASPVTVNTVTGVMGTQQITVAATGGFTGVVTLVATNPSSGLSCQPLSPATVTGSGTSTLSCSASAVGDYTVKVTGTSGSLVHATATITFHVTATVTPDFTIAPSSATTVNTNVGVAGMQTITLAATGGFTGTVTLTSQAANGLTCQPISSVTLPAVTSAMLSCSAAAVGDYAVTVTGASGTLSHSTGTITFHVTDFGLTADHSSLSCTAGGTASSGLTVTAKNGFTGTVSLSASVLPAAVTATVTPGSVQGSGSATLNVQCTNPGQYTVSVRAASVNLLHTLSIPLTVAQAPVTGFTLTASPRTITCNTGEMKSSVITVTAVGEFTGTVMLNAEASPATGLGATLSKSSITGGMGSVTLNLACNAAGTYTVTVTGTSGSLTPQSDIVTVTVTAPVQTGDFSITAEPNNLKIEQGEKAKSTITLKNLNDFTGTVTLSTKVSCDDVNARLNRVHVQLGMDESRKLKLKVSVDDDAALGACTVTVTGASGSVSHSTTVHVRIVSEEKEHEGDQCTGDGDHDDAPSGTGDNDDCRNGDMRDMNASVQQWALARIMENTLTIARQWVTVTLGVVRVLSMKIHGTNAWQHLLKALITMGTKYRAMIII